MHRENEAYWSHKDLYTNVDSSSTYNNQNQGATQLPSNNQVIKQLGASTPQKTTQQ